ncbi:MAG: hypothetical protein ACOYJB_00240 [Christensenellaceae bacterium]
METGTGNGKTDVNGTGDVVWAKRGQIRKTENKWKGEPKMIRGIDSQIMIQRSAEFSRQAADQVANAERTKEFAAALEKERALTEMQNVTELEHAENRRVDDKQKDPKDQESSEFSKGNEAQDGDAGAQADDGLRVASDKRLGGEIDINV